MGDYWRYGDRMAPGQLPSKRLRSEFDELAPAGAAYYPRDEPRFDDRDGRALLRDSEALGIGYGSGMGGTDIGLSGGRLGLSGLGASNIGLSGHDDHALLSGGRILGLDSSLIKPSPLGIGNGRPDYLSRQDSLGALRSRAPLPSDASPTLFVEGLPSDCSRREVAHIFRPFHGFKEVRLVRKDGKRPGGDPIVLCFVDFSDAHHALTAMEALRGYKLDETVRDSEPLRFQFARAAGPRGGGGRDDTRGGRDRDDIPRAAGRPFRR